MPLSPLVSFFLLIAIFALGNEIAIKTKSVISLMLVTVVLYLIGYWTGIIPLDSIQSTGLPAALTAFGLPIMVVNLGTMMDLNKFLGEWKTVLVCLIAMIGLAVACFTVGTWVFGREYALVALAPIGGGSVATIIIGDACEAAGRSDLAGYAALIFALQILIGMPVSSYMLKNQLKRMRQAGRLQSKEMLYAEEAVLHIQRKSWKNAPKW